MVQRGRFVGRPLEDDGEVTSRCELFEFCDEPGCQRSIAEACGCGKRYCNLHIDKHRLKTHRIKVKSST